MKQRAISIFKKSTILLAIGLAYVIIIRVFHFGINCPIKTLTGFSCPGCGVSTMCLALLKLDFAGAFYANPVLLIMLPIIVIIIIESVVRYIRFNSYEVSRFSRAVLMIMIILLLIFGVIRNLPFYEHYMFN